MFIHTFFFKKSEGDIVIASLRPPVLTTLVGYLEFPKFLRGPGEGSKGQISFYFNYKVNFKYFYTKLCVCSIETYPMGFSFCHLGHAPQVVLWGTGGAQVVKKLFFQTWSCGISNSRGWRAEQNASKIFVLGSNWWPLIKSSNIIKFRLPCQFQRFLFQTLLYCWGYAPGVGLGVLGGQKLQRGNLRLRPLDSPV